MARALPDPESSAEPKHAVAEVLALLVVEKLVPVALLKPRQSHLLGSDSDVLAAWSYSVGSHGSYTSCWRGPLGVCLAVHTVGAVFI
jgi:hypothetical protein